MDLGPTLAGISVDLSLPAANVVGGQTMISALEQLLDNEGTGNADAGSSQEQGSLGSTSVDVLTVGNQETSASNRHPYAHHCCAGHDRPTFPCHLMCLDSGARLPPCGCRMNFRSTRDTNRRLCIPRSRTMWLMLRRYLQGRGRKCLQLHRLLADARRSCRHRLLHDGLAVSGRGNVFGSPTSALSAAPTCCVCMM